MSLLDKLTKKTQELSQQVQQRRATQELINQLTESFKRAERDYPEDAETIRAMGRRARTELDRRLEADAAGCNEDASALTAVSRDVMRAYVCLLPPAGEGRELTAEALTFMLAAAGIVYGRNEDVLSRSLGRYLEPFLAATGDEATDGQDGSLLPAFTGKLTNPGPLLDGLEADFSADTLQAVKKGDVLCRINPATPGRAGSDVRGRKFPCRDGVQPVLPKGVNTVVSDDGLALVSGWNGILYLQNGLYSVCPALVRDGLRPGEKANSAGVMYINGDVGEGAEITSSGSVIIDGSVTGASVTSEESIRVRGSVKGGKVIASGSVTAQELTSVHIEAEENLFAERVTDCTVTVGGAITLTGEGVLSGGRATAEDQITCVTLGRSGVETEVSVGYAFGLAKEIEELREEQKSIQETLDKLLKSISGLRQGGSTLSLEKRELLQKLTEQRSLYELMEREASTRRKEIQSQLIEARSGRVRCARLEPKVIVHIGDRVGEFTKAETGCDIHVYLGQVVVK